MKSARLLKDYSLARRMTMAMVATVLGMLLLTGLALSALFLRAQIDDSREMAITQANVAASTITAAMRFGNRDVIADSLRVFETSETHNSVAVFDRQGLLVTQFVANGEAAFANEITAIPDTSNSWFMANPVRFALRDEFSTTRSAVLGTLVVSPNQRALQGAVRRALVIIVLIFLVAALTGVFVAQRFSRAILSPVSELTAWAEEVAVTKHLSAAAPRGGGIEVNRLTESFEALIAQVAEQNRALKRKEYELTASNAHLESLAYSDALTGLPNRTLFESTLETSVDGANVSGKTLALLFVDLDGLKALNDTHGHAQGDSVLRATAARIRRALRNTDFLARVAGDEFVVISPNVVGAEDAVKLGERLTVWLGIALPEDQWPHPVRASIGVAVFPDHANDVSGLIQAADLAMYRAKALPEDDSIRVVSAIIHSASARTLPSNVISWPAQGRKIQGGKI